MLRIQRRDVNVAADHADAFLLLAALTPRERARVLVGEPRLVLALQRQILLQRQPHLVRDFRHGRDIRAVSLALLDLLDCDSAFLLEVGEPLPQVLLSHIVGPLV